jgi:deoxyribonuclease V
MPYDWKTPASVEEAIALQRELARRVLAADAHGPIRSVAGVDAGFEGNTARAAVVVLAFPELHYLDHALVRRPAGMPYVPGLLSFREAPAILAALEALREAPDLLLLDGQGIAHPRRLGIASHVGIVTDLPAIGVAKSLLTGRHPPVPDERGAHVWLRDGDEIIGAVLRTRPGVKPLYVSLGHRVSLETALHYVLACTTRFRLPETTRAAHNLASHGTLPPGAPPAAPEQQRLL